MRKVYILEPEWEESHNIIREVADVFVGVSGVKYSEDQLINMLRDFDAVIITSQHKISRGIIYNCHKLKVIVKYGSKPGIDNVDLEAATERRIPVCYTFGANYDSVAEFTVGLMLHAIKKISIISQSLREGLWRDSLLRSGVLGYELRGKTVGIIGLGQIGRRVAKILQGFNVKMLGYDPYISRDVRSGVLGYELRGKTVGIIGLGQIGRRVAKILQGFNVKMLGYDPYISRDDIGGLNVELVKDLGELLRSSDIITIHATLTGETYHMIGEEEFKVMKPTAILVNTARGAIVDEEALIKALREKWIAGAALDVFEKEPPDPNNPLLKLPNVISTPHYASCTYEAYRREAIIAAEEVVRVLEGYKPRYIANPEVLKALNLKDGEPEVLRKFRELW